MSFFRKLKEASIATRVFDEKIHEIVIREIENGIRRDGLWAQAIAKGEGNERKAKAIYISLRVQSIKDELELSKHDNTLDRSAQQRQQRDELDSSRKNNTIGAYKIQTSSVTTVKDDPIDAYDSDGCTQLMRAVLSGDLAKVYRLLGKGADPLKTDLEWGATSSIDLALRLRSAANSKEESECFSLMLMALENHSR